MFLNSLPFVVLLALVGGSGEQAHHIEATHHPSSGRASASGFTHGVDRYMDVRWMLEAPLDPSRLCADPEETQRALESLARAIRSERAGARPGDIFTPAIAAFFRQQIGAALREDGHEFQTYLEDPTTGIPIDLPTVEVNGTLPWGVGDQLGPLLMTKLPALPVELEYRLVGHDLVLLDVSLNLVVDILEQVDRNSSRAQALDIPAQPSTHLLLSAP